MSQRHLRHVRDTMKFRFGKEGSADVNAVDSAGELPVHPNLDGVGISQAVELTVHAKDGGGDPGGVAIGATAHDVVEGLVIGDLEGRFPQSAGQRARGVKLAERKDGPPPRMVPRNHFAAGVAHGEPSGLIRRKHGGRIESSGDLNDVH